MNNNNDSKPDGHFSDLHGIERSLNIMSFVNAVSSHKMAGFIILSRRYRSAIVRSLYSRSNTKYSRNKHGFIRQEPQTDDPINAIGSSCQLNYVISDWSRQ